MKEPKRWHEALDDGALRRALEAGRSERPRDAQLGAMAAKLGLSATALGVGSAGAAGTPLVKAGAVATGVATVTKAAVVCVLGVAIGVAVTASRSEVRDVGSTNSAPAAPVETPALPEKERLLAPAVAPAPTPGRTSSEPHPSKRSPPSSSAEPPASIDEEVRLLARMQDAVARDPEGALALGREHRRRFGGGVLEQEREVLAIEALAKLGRLSEAGARADAFKQRFPRSGHARRVAAVLRAAALDTSD